MVRIMPALLAAGVLVTAMAAPAQRPIQPPMPKRIAMPPRPAAVPLYPDQPAGVDTEIWDDLGDQRAVRNVNRPTLEAFLPDPDKATGAAVVVAPGGAFVMLAMDNEGWPVARWLADHGIAAFVLKYRLNPTPADEKAFMAGMMARFAAAEQAGGGNPPPIREPRATQDMLAALRSIRADAAKWKIDPKRVGAIGFSAGAMTVLTSVQDGDAATAPAFVGSIYGPMTAVPVRKDAPPLFTALALDDPLFGGQGFGIVESWRKAGVPVEVHAYEKGGHGYGMGRPGTTTTMMMDQFVGWLQSRGLLTPAPR